MTRSSCWRRLAAIAAVAGLLLPASAWAQTASWPNKPIKLVVAFPPGGTTDIVARILGQRLTMSLGQAVVIENKPGAGGLVGTDAVAKATPDGYTYLLANSGALAAGISLYPQVPYDPIKDFAPVTMVNDVTIVLGVPPSLPVKSLKELLDLARAKPGTLNVAIPSLGSMHHLLTEMFKLSAKVDIVNVVYKGSGPAVTDLIAGNVQMDFDNLPAMISYINSGMVRAIAVASPKRSDLLPNVPTMIESGMPDIVASPWFAMVAPAGTPPGIIRRFNASLVQILKSADFKQKLDQQGANPLWTTPEEAGAFIRSELEKWDRVVKLSGVKLD
jgi:tripartite-type tricarboxylate transporter receptor subunit TctC